MNYFEKNVFKKPQKKEFYLVHDNTKNLKVRSLLGLNVQLICLNENFLSLNFFELPLHQNTIEPAQHELCDIHSQEQIEEDKLRLLEFLR